MKGGQYGTIDLVMKDKGVFPFRIAKALLNISSSSVCGNVEKAYNNLKSKWECDKIEYQKASVDGEGGAWRNQKVPVDCEGYACPFNTSTERKFFYGLGFEVDVRSVYVEGDQIAKYWRSLVREIGPNGKIVRNRTSGLVDAANKEKLYLEMTLTRTTTVYYDFILQYLDENKSVLGHAPITKNQVKYAYVPKQFTCDPNCMALLEKLSSYFNPDSSTNQCKTAEIAQRLSEFSICKGRCLSFLFEIYRNILIQIDHIETK